MSRTGWWCVRVGASKWVARSVFTTYVTTHVHDRATFTNRGSARTARYQVLAGGESKKVVIVKVSRKVRA